MIKNMNLITSTWGQGNKKTFKMIPMSPGSHLNEVIFDPETQVLVLISKERKQSFHMMPKLDDRGDLEQIKMGRRANGKDYKEERKTVETFYEYYIEEQKEIIEFIEAVGLNSDTFNYSQYFLPKDAPVKPEVSTIITS